MKGDAAHRCLTPTRRLGASLFFLGVVLLAGMLHVRDRETHSLHLACYRGNSDRAIRLLEEDRSKIDERASLPFRPSDGKVLSPLMWSIEGGRLRTTEWLLREGADVNLTDEFGRSALYFAAFRQEVDIARMLLEAGGDPDVLTTFGSSPLLAAIQGQCVPIVAALLGHGADPNLEGSLGALPLIEAMDAGNREIVRLLLDAGARTTQRNEQGVTPQAYTSRLEEPWQSTVLDLFESRSDF